MNHLSRKKKLYGAGSKRPKVTPAVLSPPKIGRFEFGSSFSYVETLDLISDGPIEGLVDPQGNLLDSENKSRGIYLDGTPVSIAIESLDSNTEISLSEESKMSKDITSFNNFLEQGASVSEENIWNGYGHDDGNRTARFRHINLIDGIDPLVSITRYTEGYLKSDFVTYDSLISSTGRPAVRVNDPNGEFLFSTMDAHYFIFPNASTIANSDFVVSYFRDYYVKEKGRIQQDGMQGAEFTNSFGFKKIADHFFAEKDGVSSAKNYGKKFFEDILDALNTYSAKDSEGNVANEFMTNLIKFRLNKAFGGSWWEGKKAIDLYDYFFGKGGFHCGHMAIYYPPRNLLDSFAEADEITFSSYEKAAFMPSDDSFNRSTIYNSNNYYDLLIPVCDENGRVQKELDLIGAVFIMVEHAYAPFYQDHSPNDISSGIRNFDFDYFLDKLSLVTKFNLTNNTLAKLQGSKYNYNNVLIETRNGEESQEPFNFFNKVHIDKSVNKAVFGPFKANGLVQRLGYNKEDNKSSLNDIGYDAAGGTTSTDDVTLVDGFPIDEGSNDNNRRANDSGVQKDYSNWNKKNKSFLDEVATPVTHTIHNPNVSEVFITLQIDSLYDTVEKDYEQYSTTPVEEKFKAGDKLPGIMNIEVEVGKILQDGTEQPTLRKKYRIAALIEGTTLLDIGNPSNVNLNAKYVKDEAALTGNDSNDKSYLSEPFALPRVGKQSLNNTYSSPEKRYIKVSKLSTETFSVLLSKELSFYKVTEVIPVNLTYPFSAIIGTKVDSKSFSSMPQRAFDARLKKIKIPNNYFPTDEEGYKRDRRYYNKKSDLSDTPASRKTVYKGDWNGEFKEGWTDNPAWILYDLLTNKRYGLGQYVEERDINKWELYKIGRFCDAVDSDGVFVGVPDGRGGLEPRYSCNILFKSNEKVFDSVQLISKLFRGQTFFRASEVSFTDERIKSPIATFNNNNVKDGAFNYSNLRRDQQFNTVEVSYLDRFENFTPKVEVIEDEEDIRSRGVFKKRVDGTGVTSRAMARRIGHHLIYRTVKENQRVVFSSGLEALLCQPGDLIIVDDDLKNQKSNFGKVLSVDVDNEYIQLSGPWSSTTMTGVLTVYNPTGDDSISYLSDLATSKRSRVENFTILDISVSAFDSYTGAYKFSGYTSGYNDLQIESETTIGLSEEYALYTGTGDNILSFNTTYTGWVFSTSLEEADRDFISNEESVQSIAQLNASDIANYDTNETSRRGSTVSSMTDYIDGELFPFNGVLESEITLNSNPQIVTLYPDTVGTGDGFTFASGFNSSQYLQFIKLGSPYRFDLKNADDVLYKIDSIKESSPNEYLVSASKFETGKFSLIEENISLERKENTFDYNVATQIGDVTYTPLSAPENLTLTTGAGTETNTFYISGSWDEVTNNNGYEAILRLPNTNSITLEVDSEGAKFDNIYTVGNFSLSVKAVGDSSTSNKTIDSEYATIKSFILYEELEEFTKSHIKLITFS